MFTRPADIADADIATALLQGWDFDAVDIGYLAVGFGSHHWSAEDANGASRFVTVDDLSCRDFLGGDEHQALDGLRRAFEVARALSTAGLEWVVGPLEAVDGQVLRRLDDRYSIAAFPYVTGETSPAYTSDAERHSVVGLLAELHRLRPSVEVIARRETFELPHRRDVEVALTKLAEPWAGGPFSERARSLLRGAAAGVQSSLAEYDRLAEHAKHQPPRWGVTHGEPHSRNVLRTSEGLRVIDWDTALVGPPERDLWMLFSDPADPLAAAYEAAAGHAPDADLLSLYALWWNLIEIGIYVAEFRAPHADDANTRQSWVGLEEAVQNVDSGPTHG